MSKEPPAWHAEAKQLYAQGVPVGEIARRIGRPPSSVSWAVDANNARQRTREGVRARRAGKSRSVLRAAVRRAPEPAPAEPEFEIQVVRKPTLPKVSLPDLADEPAMPPVIRFVPRTRREPEGVDRWRFHHLKMIREGRIAVPGLIEQLHH